MLTATPMKRAILIVLDSVGVGALPDAAEYGDEDCNTLSHVAEYAGGLCLPNMEGLGLGGIIPIKGVKDLGLDAKGSFGKAAEKSKGKDTNTGHYEMMGLVLDKPFKTYPKGFPKDIIDRFCRVCKFDGVLGNKTASGTAIIDEFGEEHMKTGLPIVYTSADSVFQIAAHEAVIPPEKLWKVCKETLTVFNDPQGILRVIARPFVGEVGNFTRTSNRRDFTEWPLERTFLDDVKDSGLTVYGIGKIEDIYNKKGITKAVHTEDNLDGITKTIEAIRREENGLIFTNLVDFDMKFGHRNDPAGYAKTLSVFDHHLPDIMKEMRDEDILIITADHGCDPTYSESTDHSREYIPVLIYGKNLMGGVNLGIRDSFADIGMTICDFFDIKSKITEGKSMLKDLMLIA